MTTVDTALTALTDWQTDATFNNPKSNREINALVDLLVRRVLPRLESGEPIGLELGSAPSKFLPGAVKAIDPNLHLYHVKALGPMGCLCFTLNDGLYPGALVSARPLEMLDRMVEFEYKGKPTEAELWEATEV